MEHLGSGAGIACGDLAREVIAGFGSGALRAEGPAADEFYLDTGAWQARYGTLEGVADIPRQARRLGERLRDA